MRFVSWKNSNSFLRIIQDFWRWKYASSFAESLSTSVFHTDVLWKYCMCPKRFKVLQYSNVFPFSIFFSFSNTFVNYAYLIGSNVNSTCSWHLFTRKNDFCEIKMFFHFQFDIIYFYTHACREINKRNVGIIVGLRHKTYQSVWFFVSKSKIFQIFFFFFLQKCQSFSKLMVQTIFLFNSCYFFIRLWRANELIFLFSCIIFLLFFSI